MAITNGNSNGTGKAIGPTAAQIEAVKAVVRPNLIKQTMLENRLAYSFGMRVAFSVEMPLVAKRAGYTSLLMNMEHMAIDMQTMSNVCVSCLNVGYAALVFELMAVSRPRLLSRQSQQNGSRDAWIRALRPSSSPTSTT